MKNFAAWSSSQRRSAAPCLFLHESYAAASLQLRESWELLIASLGMEDPLTTRTMVLLSRTLIALGDLESGMEIGRGALKNLVKLYGRLRRLFSFHPEPISSGGWPKPRS